MTSDIPAMPPYPVHVMSGLHGRVARFGGPDNAVFVVAAQVAAITDITSVNAGELGAAVDVSLVGGGVAALRDWAVPPGGASAVAQILFGEQGTQLSFEQATE